MINIFRLFTRDNKGGTAAEFGLVLPLLVLLFLGVIDVGRLLYTWNEAEKATQIGARFAVVTAPVAGDLATHNFTYDGLAPGSVVPTTVFSHLECVSGKCQSCSGSACGNFSNGYGYNPTSFANLVFRMSAIFPAVKAANLQIDYDNAGLGYVSDPNAPNVTASVTVRLKNLTFTPALFKLLGTSITLPDFKTTLTMEDGIGSQSN